MSNDGVVRYAGRYLQLRPSCRCYGPRSAKAVIYESEEGRLEVRYGGASIAWEEIPAPPRGPQPETQAASLHVPCSRPRYHPGPEHPYKRHAESNIKCLRRRRLVQAVAARAGAGASIPPHRAAENAAPGSTPAPAPSSIPNEGTLHLLLD